MDTEKIYPVRNFGSVMSPFYNVIALWIGALFAAVMIHVSAATSIPGHVPIYAVPIRDGCNA